MASFGISLVFLAVLPGRGRWHPAARAAVAVLAVMVVALFHPDTNGLLGGLAQIGFNLSILAPLFWAARMRMDVAALKKALLLIWAFHSVSSGFGVLQVYFPGRFQPNVSQVLVDQSAYLDALQITTATGERTLRPMGLTDVPGGASMAGFYAFMLGTGFLLTSRSYLFRALCVASMLLGITALYLSYVRSVLVLLLICMVAMAVVLAVRGRVKQLLTFSVVAGAVAVLGFSAAAALGGEGMLNRMGTLVEDDPSAVYNRNRGIFLVHTFGTLLPEYPLGAGLARWGMMALYFGDSGAVNPELWVEIQWTGWLVDGGAPLMLAYAAAMALALWVAFLVAMGRLGGEHRELWLLGVLIFAYDVGGLALTFNFPFFASQSGLEFWVLNALLFGAATQASAKSGAALAPVAGGRGPARGARARLV